jgi:hypothetical protein
MHECMNSAGEGDLFLIDASARKGTGCSRTNGTECADLLLYEDRTACIVQTEEGLQVLEVVRRPHLLQGLTGKFVHNVVPLCQMPHELWL